MRAAYLLAASLLWACGHDVELVDEDSAVSDQASTLEDSAVVIDVLANDTSPAAVPLDIGSFAQPAHGIVTRDQRTLTYTPQADYCGSDTFSYTLASTPQKEATVTVSVTCVNDAPSFVLTGATLAIDEDAPTSSTEGIAGWVTTISAGPSDEAQAVSFIVDATSLSLFENGEKPTLDANGTLSYKLAAEQSGASTVSVQLHDDGGTANGGKDTSPVQTFMIVVNAVDDPPVAVNDALTVVANSAQSIVSVLNNDTDIDAGAKQVVTVSAPAHGSAAVINGGAAVGYTPTPGYAGADAFTYTLNGGSQATVTVSVTCSLPQVATDGACQSPALYAVHPTTVAAGTTLVLEGVFGTAAHVAFPGVGPVTATVLGAQRATVVVPSGATSGDVTVTTNGTTTAGQRIRVATFALKQGMFRATYEQASYAQRTPKPIAARVGAVALKSGRWLYVFGGYVGGTAVNSIERALVNADGSLGPFTSVGTLASARAYPSLVRVGDRLVITGGISSGNQALATIEEATIANDGTVGAFSLRADTLGTARSRHASFVVGRWLYVLGGSTAIERAPISSAGVGAFSTVATALLQARARASVVVTDTRVFVIGGETTTALSTIEQASIAGDGTLGTFAAAGVSLASARAGAVATLLDKDIAVIGGTNGTQSLASVERTTLQADGTLGAFAPVNSLSTARDGASLEIVDNFVYVLGGTATASFERATIIGAHALGAETVVVDNVDGEPAVNFPLGQSYYRFTGSRVTAENSFDRASVNEEGQLGAFSPTGISGMSPGRNGPMVAVAGTKVHVIGGVWTPSGGCCDTFSTALTASIDSTGNLGNFASSGFTMLDKGYASAATLVLGDSLYIIGGGYQTLPSTYIQRSPLDATGALGSFQSAGTSLVVGRTSNAGRVVLGNRVYIIGGQTTSGMATTSIEVATFSGSTLGSFSTYGQSLNVPRLHAGTVVIGDRLYVFSGNTGTQPVTSIEVAQINADNTLGPFQIVSGLSTTGYGVMLFQNQYVTGSPVRAGYLTP